MERYKANHPLIDILVLKKKKKKISIMSLDNLHKGHPWDLLISTSKNKNNKNHRASN